MRSSHIVGSALGSLILLSGPALAAGAPQKKMPPEPDKLVQRMCDYLKSLNRFYRAEVSDDRCTQGEKINTPLSRDLCGAAKPAPGQC